MRRVSATAKLRMQSKFASLIAVSHRRRVSSVFLGDDVSITSCHVSVGQMTPESSARVSGFPILGERASS
jgi:hypothetical protein